MNRKNINLSWTNNLYRSENPLFDEIVTNTKITKPKHSPKPVKLGVKPTTNARKSSERPLMHVSHVHHLNMTILWRRHNLCVDETFVAHAVRFGKRLGQRRWHGGIIV